VSKRTWGAIIVLRALCDHTNESLWQRRSLFALAILMLLGCSREAEKAAPRSLDQSGAPGESLRLSQSQLDGLAEMARVGDVAAMMTIAAHYDFGVSEPDKAVPWLEMAVDRGSTKAMKSLAIHLATQGGEANCNRAEQLFVQALKDAADDGERTRIRRSFDSFMAGEAAGRCGRRQQSN